MAGYQTRVYGAIGEGGMLQPNQTASLSLQSLNL